MHAAARIVHMNLELADHLGPAAAALVFIALMSRVREPVRRELNAILVAGAGGVYLSGGFGVWELVLPALIGALAYFGLRSYRWIGVAWLLHAGWDVLHHFHGNPIWPFMPTSSWGCMIFDSIIALWFLGRPASFDSVLASRGPRSG
jgi:hypothetical protein